MKNVKIGGKIIGKGEPAYIIAEIGSNHDGSFERAVALIESAALAGADAVKFQSFTADGLVARKVRDAQGDLVPNFVHPIIQNLTLPAEWHEPLQKAAKCAGVDFISAPFDLDRLHLLVKMKVPAIKIASGDLTYVPLLEASAKSGIPVILSTGMAEFWEIERSLKVLRDNNCAGVVLLHCVTSYPTVLQDANVMAVKTLAERFDVPVGLSDHSMGLAVPLAAVSLGAKVVERHFTMSRSLCGPDHPYATEPHEFKQMVEVIREIEFALGDGQKNPGKAEQAERLVGRRSVHAARDIVKGEVIGETQIKLVRPGGGVDPFNTGLVLGKKARRDIQADEMIREGDVE